MHKLILKIFELIKNILNLAKIFALLCIIVLLLYWVKQLAGLNMPWLNTLAPLYVPFLSIGESINKGSFDILGTPFEYKYGIAVLLYVVLIMILGYAVSFVEKLEELYDSARSVTNNYQQKFMNNAMLKAQEQHETKLNKYKIFVTTTIKKKFSHADLGVNIDEQNLIMNKYLIGKTGIDPMPYEGGFLYSFSSFSNIDNVLVAFFNLIESNSQLDYYISVQICGENSVKEMEQIRSLNKLQFVNKICMFSDTSYRYKFNKGHRYGTSHLGVYQIGTETCEVHEFIEI